MANEKQTNIDLASSGPESNVGAVGKALGGSTHGEKSNLFTFWGNQMTDKYPYVGGHA